MFLEKILSNDRLAGDVNKIIFAHINDDHHTWKSSPSFHALAEMVEVGLAQQGFYLLAWREGRVAEVAHLLFSTCQNLKQTENISH